MEIGVDHVGVDHVKTLVTIVFSIKSCITITVVLHILLLFQFVLVTNLVRIDL